MAIKPLTTEELKEVYEDPHRTDRERVDAFRKAHPDVVLASQFADLIGIPHEAVMHILEEDRKKRDMRETPVGPYGLGYTMKRAEFLADEWELIDSAMEREMRSRSGHAVFLIDAKVTQTDNGHVVYVFYEYQGDPIKVGVKGEQWPNHGTRWAIWTSTEVGASGELWTEGRPS